MSSRFTSAMGQEFEAFLAFKRALGYRYRRAEFVLLSLDRFIRARTAAVSETAFAAILLEWQGARHGRKSISVDGEIAIVRQFCFFRRRQHPDAFVPGRDWSPQSTESVFEPYVLSLTEVRDLLALASKLPDAFHALTVGTLLLILYCTGLRFGEPFRLRMCDVNLDDAVLSIAESKGRSRLVPFGEDLAKELSTYLAQRNTRAAADADSPFLIQPDGTALGVRKGSDIVRELLRRAGLKPAHGRVGPRPYDFRHTFAVHRLTRWYHEGVADLHAQLPWLSAYMGHYDLIGTEVYLKATPELMAIAADRFEKRLATARRPK